jgi:hypothetical protein
MCLQLGPTHGKNIDLRMFENSAKRRMFEKDEEAIECERKLH